MARRNYHYDDDDYNDPRVEGLKAKLFVGAIIAIILFIAQWAGCLG